jgi:cyclase
MLRKRIIPCLDVDKGRVVKGINFLNLRDAGDPVELAEFYDAEGADELVFLDIGASHEGRETMVEVVRKVADKIFIPFTVGGGIRTSEDIRYMLESGADKVSLNTAAVYDHGLIRDAAKYFGNQCIVVAIDAKRIDSTSQLSAGSFNVHRDIKVSMESRWGVYSHGGREFTGIDVIKWATRAAALGAGELLVTSMDADGSQSGYDLDMMQTISRSVSIPVIASGGAGNPEHLAQVLEIGEVDAVLAASIFHYGTHSIHDVKTFLSERGIPIRQI